MVTIEIVINSTRVMGVCVAISCRYCIAFEVMLLVSGLICGSVPVTASMFINSFITFSGDINM